MPKFVPPTQNRSIVKSKLSQLSSVPESKARVKVSAAQAIKALDMILSDDNCHEWECVLHLDPEQMSEREKEMARKIGDCYRIAHSADTGICHGVHDDWRKFTLSILEGNKCRSSSRRRKLK